VSAFVVTSEDVLCLAPEHSACRSNILDYFAGQRSRVPDDHVLFPLEYYAGEAAGTAGKGAQAQQHQCASALLMRQLCWEMGFANDDHLLYVTGQRSDIIDLYPELEVYRDVTGMFKFMTLAAPGRLPDVQQWFAKDAKMQWRAIDDKFAVRAFGQDVKLALPDGLAAPRKEGFLAALFRSRCLYASSRVCKGSTWCRSGVLKRLYRVLLVFARVCRLCTLLTALACVPPSLAVGRARAYAAERTRRPCAASR
jgi:hypothetical protein